jgi:hypothetical protein
MSTQRKIDHFFTGSPESNKNKKIQLKKYFYIAWTDKYKPDKQAYWTDVLPEKVNFSETIRCVYIKKGYTFTICGYFPDIDEKKYLLKKETIYNNLSFLQSHLQICIRKQNDILAIPTAYHLLKMNTMELLKSLSIIMLEDTSLHTSITTITWLMIALQTKSFKCKQYIYEWILGIVYVLCKIESVDSYDSSNQITEDGKTIIELLDSYSELKETEYSVLYSIHLLISYESDIDKIELLKKVLHTWYHRLDKTINRMKVRPISLFIRDLELSEWDISSIHHLSHDTFITYIHKKYNDIEVQELQRIILINSFNVNYRVKDERNHNQNDIVIWNKIKDYVLKTQRYLLEQSY